MSTVTMPLSLAPTNPNLTYLATQYIIQTETKGDRHRQSDRWRQMQAKAETDNEGDRQ